MGVISFDMESTYVVPPARLFKALVIDGDNLIPKIVPQAIEKVEVIEGNGGPGTIKKITFGEGSQYKYAMHRIEAIDKDKLTFSYSIIGGDVLMNVFEKICQEIKFEASASEGCICKDSSKYFTMGDFEVTEAQLKDGKEKSSGLTRAVEAYLLANPDAYN